MRREFDEYRERVKFYWIYKVVTFIGILLILSSILFMVVMANHSDWVTMVDPSSETWSTMEYLFYALVSIAGVWVGSLLVRFGEYAVSIQEDWIDRFEDEVCDIL